MKKLLPFAICVLILGCRDEKDVDPANSGTFMRYYGSQHSHTAVLAEEAHGGYTLLSNLDVPVEGGTVGDFNYKIRVIHTDVFGHTQWERTYPAEISGTLDGYKASSFIATGDGYLIVGERINTDGGGYSELLLLRIDTEGGIMTETSLAIPDPTPTDTEDARPSLQGHAAGVNSVTGNFVVLGAISGHPQNLDMFVAEVSSMNLTTQWAKEYGSGPGSILNRVYVRSNENILWGGSTTIRGPRDVRLVTVEKNSLSNNDDICCDPAVEEEAFDFAETIGGYVFVGASQSTAGDYNIFFTKVSYSGQELSTPAAVDYAGLDDKAVSVCPGVDGGYMILATVESNAGKGNGAEDLLLYKVNDSGVGNIANAINYGSSDTEEGASVRATSDNSYLVFGTVYFGELRKLVLMKVNSKGEL